MTNDSYWNTRAHVHTLYMQRCRRCFGQQDVGCNFTGLSHAFRIALQPYCFLQRSGVYVCFSVLGDIQSRESKNKEAKISFKWPRWFKC